MHPLLQHVWNARPSANFILMPPLLAALAVGLCALMLMAAETFVAGGQPIAKFTEELTFVIVVYGITALILVFTLHILIGTPLQYLYNLTTWRLPLAAYLVPPLGFAYNFTLQHPTPLSISLMSGFITGLFGWTYAYPGAWQHFTLRSLFISAQPKQG